MYWGEILLLHTVGSWCACYPLKSCKKRILCSKARFLSLADWVNWRNKGIGWVYGMFPIVYVLSIHYTTSSVWSESQEKLTKRKKREEWNDEGIFPLRFSRQSLPSLFTLLGKLTYLQLSIKMCKSRAKSNPMCSTPKTSSKGHEGLVQQHMYVTCNFVYCSTKSYFGKKFKISCETIWILLWCFQFILWKDENLQIFQSRQ